MIVTNLQFKLEIHIWKIFYLLFCMAINFSTNTARKKKPIGTLCEFATFFASNPPPSHIWWNSVPRKTFLSLALRDPEEISLLFIAFFRKAVNHFPSSTRVFYISCTNYDPCTDICWMPDIYGVHTEKNDKYVKLTFPGGWFNNWERFPFNDITDFLLCDKWQVSN